MRINEKESRLSSGTNDTNKLHRCHESPTQNKQTV